MKTCSLCGYEILSYQSYHSDGHSLVHMACEHHRSPADHESYDRYFGDPNLMLPKRKHIPHTRDGRTGNVPPHLRDKESK